jgi:hypothetical protein
VYKFRFRFHTILVVTWHNILDYGRVNKDERSAYPVLYPDPVMLVELLISLLHLEHVLHELFVQLLRHIGLR